MAAPVSPPGTDPARMYRLPFTHQAGPQKPRASGGGGGEVLIVMHGRSVRIEGVPRLVGQQAVVATVVQYATIYPVDY